MCLQCPALFYNSFSEEEEHPSDQPNSTNSPTNNQNDTTNHSSSTPTPTPDNPPTRSSRFEYVVEKFALLYGITTNQVIDMWGEGKVRDIQNVLNDIDIVSEDNAQLIRQISDFNLVHP